MRTSGDRRRHGFTLIELLVAVVVLAALGSALASVFIEGSRASADPMIRAQARAIAEAYMDEILLQPYEDPDDPESGGAEGESRGGYDDVWDYADIGSEPPTDQFGNAIAGLGAYTVTITLDGTAGSDPAAVEVRVVHGTGKVDYVLHGERRDY